MNIKIDEEGLRQAIKEIIVADHEKQLLEIINGHNPVPNGTPCKMPSRTVSS